MNEERQRLTKGLAAALALHLAAAALVGFLGYSFVTRPPQILEVTLVGGGGAPQEVIEEPQEESVVRSIDDIIDKRLKQETRKVVKKKSVKPSPQVSKKPAPPTANPDAVGSGEANASGSGEGGGEGDGTGAGSGRGVPVTPPRVVYSVQPKYPSAARSQGIEGTAAVKMLVSADGKVQEAFIARSSGNAALDEAALAAVYKWRFSPAKDKFGQKAPCYVTQGIRFDLRR